MGLLQMVKIQEIKYKDSHSKVDRVRYVIPLEMKIVKQLALKKGDELFFNGEFGEEIRFKIERC